MLKLVMGRSGYGKTEYVFKAVRDLAFGGEKNIILLTPEQYSLSAERRLLTDLGCEKMSYVLNGSFSRLSNDVKSIYGGDTLPILSKGGKAVLMLQAIEMSKDGLELFNKNLDSLNFVSSMLSIYDEMRSCNLSATEILDLSRPIENVTLNKKMKDISHIMGMYENLIAKRFLDPSDELTRLYDKIKDKGYFKDRYVFIDGFNGFVAQEYKILELIVAEAKEVTITLCCDREPENALSTFAYVKKSETIIRRIAEKAGIPVSEVYLESNMRSYSDSVRYIEKNIFANAGNKKVDNDGCVSVYKAKTINDECEEVAREIRKLLRAGYNASQIAVIARDIDKYRDELGFVFNKYEIPFFNDERQPIKSQPLVMFIEYLFRCINFSLKSNDIISLAKTGLTPLSDEEINELENYIYLWNINGSKWTKPFENSTRGFVDKIDEKDRLALENINKSREALTEPILRFRRSVKGKTAKDICAELYYTLIRFGADKRIKESAVFLSESGHISLAQMQGRVWDSVMEILDLIPRILGDEPINLKSFSKLFSVIIANEDLGMLPTGIDNVQFGQADRIRTDNPKAVFVLGANEDEFPQAITTGGLLTESDRRVLLENDFKLYSYGEIMSQQEKYFAYMAVSCASDKLHISYIENASRSSSESEIVTSVTSLINGLNAYSYDDIADIDLVETYQNAFELMSREYEANTEFSSSLKKCFENDSRYKSICAIAENIQPEITDRSVSTKLFDYNMLVSASRIEDYFNCSFRYFCKFGLGARPLKKTELDALKRGTLIHYVLEMILSELGSKNLSQMEPKEIIAAVDKYIKQYFVVEMGNISDMGERFYYNYNRISNQIYNVVLHLALEFKNCDFEARAFELDIDSDGSVKPSVISLDDGGSVSIRGSIDRVDTFDKDGRRYVRVVDYKSGGKEFDLSDVMFGLNLQMFIYLFCLCGDKKAELSGVPAGVLYMHANQKVTPFSSKKEAEEKGRDNLEKSLKMMGLVISGENDETIPNAMEHDIKGEFIPVVRDRRGNLIGSLASLEELGRIQRKVNDLISEMGENLHKGMISRNPVSNKNHKHTCDYCDYRDICSNQRLISERAVPDLKHEEIMKLLSEEYESDAGVDDTTE